MASVVWAAIECWAFPQKREAEKEIHALECQKYQPNDYRAKKGGFAILHKVVM